MLAFLGLLLLIWIAFIVIGALVKAVFWLLIVGAILFVATSLFGFVKRRV